MWQREKQIQAGCREVHIFQNTHKYTHIIYSINLSLITIHPLHSKMTQILSQDTFSRQRNSSSFTSSQLSLGSSCGTKTPHKWNLLHANNFGFGSSKYSLIRMNKSSLTLLRQMVLTHLVCNNQNIYSSSLPLKQHAQWPNLLSLARSDASIRGCTGEC